MWGAKDAAARPQRLSKFRQSRAPSPATATTYHAAAHGAPDAPP